jgi:hypothetical protein
MSSPSLFDSQPFTPNNKSSTTPTVQRTVPISTIVISPDNKAQTLGDFMRKHKQQQRPTTSTSTAAGKMTTATTATVSNNAF